MTETEKNSLMLVARHLDMSERNARDVVLTLKLDYKINTLDEIRIAYIRRLREQSAGRGSEHQIEAAIARTRKDNMAAEMIEMQIKEKSGLLVSVTKIEPFITSLIIAARQQFINLPRKWTQELQAIHNLDVDEQYFQTDINDALNQLSDADIFSDESDDAARDESLGSARETADFAMGD